MRLIELMVVVRSIENEEDAEDIEWVNVDNVEVDLGAGQFFSAAAVIFFLHIGGGVNRLTIFFGGSLRRTSTYLSAAAADFGAKIGAQQKQQKITDSKKGHKVHIC